MRFKVKIHGFVFSVSRNAGKGRLVFGIAIWDERERCTSCKKPMTKRVACYNDVCFRCCEGDCSVCWIHQIRDEETYPYDSEREAVYQDAKQP